MNAKELAEIVDKLGWLPSPESGINPDLSRDAWATILRALRLLAAAEGGEGTPETDALVDSTLPVQKWVIARDLCRRLERERNGLAARVRELEGDAERLRKFLGAISGLRVEIGGFSASSQETLSWTRELAQEALRGEPYTFKPV